MSATATAERTLEDWLAWQLTLHASEMDLGLDRVSRVAERLGCLPLSARTVVIAGTNGKGSCAALLDSLLSVHGRVGTFTSPHLWRYNERIRIDGEQARDGDLCLAFAAIEEARGDISLTYFEFGTLAALWLFAREGVDYAVLEVGLGGRLDAVNIVDADVSLITNIGLDHIDWLGGDRESIGKEKAGILRTDRPAVCADRDMPASIADAAARLELSLARIGRDFDLVCQDHAWYFQQGDGSSVTIPLFDGVLVDNLAAVLAVHQALLGDLPTLDAIASACEAQYRLPGRRERIDGSPAIIYDVAHNAEAVAVLVDDLQAHPVFGQTHVVLGMLADKPVARVVELLAPVATRFYLAGLDALSTRGLSAGTLAARAGLGDSACFGDPAAALQGALAVADNADRIVVCGSFLTVAEARGHQ